MALAVAAIADGFGERTEYARRRYRVIAASAELRERELVKLAAVTDALAAGLRSRGVTEHTASVAAQTGMAVFRTAFDRWGMASDARDLRAHVREAFDALGIVVTAR